MLVFLRSFRICAPTARMNESKSRFFSLCSLRSVFSFHFIILSRLFLKHIHLLEFLQSRTALNSNGRLIELHATKSAPLNESSIRYVRQKKRKFFRSMRKSLLCSVCAIAATFFHFSSFFLVRSLRTLLVSVKRSFSFLIGYCSFRLRLFIRILAPLVQL